MIFIRFLTLDLLYKKSLSCVIENTDLTEIYQLILKTLRFGNI
jgi:hypothetical protein